MFFLEKPNIALGKPAYHSSNYDSAAVAGRAVDGNRNGNWADASCTATREQKYPWWAVDLGREMSVLEVMISNRIDAFSELSVVLFEVVRANR